MKDKILFFAFLLLISNSLAQNKWSGGTYFIPSYLDYEFAEQKINFNLLSGITISKEISSRVSLNSGIFYFQNRIYGDTNSCYVCAPNTVKVFYKIKFLEVPFGVKASFPKVLKSWKGFDPLVITGVVFNFNFHSTEIDTDAAGRESEFYNKKLQFHKIYGYLGISLRYHFNENTFILIDPLIRFSPGATEYGYSLISYDEMFGIGIGININLN